MLKAQSVYSLKSSQTVAGKTVKVFVVKIAGVLENRGLTVVIVVIVVVVIVVVIIIVVIVVIVSDIVEVNWQDSWDFIGY